MMDIKWMVDGEPVTVGYVDDEVGEVINGALMSHMSQTKRIADLEEIINHINPCPFCGVEFCDERLGNKEPKNERAADERHV